MLRLIPLLLVSLLALPALGQTPTNADPDHVKFSARDSLVITGKSDAREGRLFGNAKVTSDEVELDAYKISIGFSESMLHAEGLASDSGLVGRPTFQKGDEKFEGKQLSYDLDSGKGRVVGARSVIEEGYLYAGVTKQESESVVYVKDAMYTTCNIENDPHYHVQAGKMKIVNGNWIYTGPMHLRILNVPLPLWLPFGFLPAKEGRRSGPLPPSIGEDSRGFFVRDFGWYFAMNDYTDLQTRFGVWTGGSFEIAPTFRYAKRYHYSGQAGFDWVRNVQGLKDDPDYVRVDTWSIRANHLQTLSNTASLTSHLDFTTSNYLKTASRDYVDNVRQTIGSDVQLSKRWRTRTLTAYMNQRQVLTSGEVKMQLPRISFVQQTLRPFASRQPTSGPGLLETISVGYRGTLNNTYTFLRDTTLAGSGDINWWDALWSPSKYTQATGNEDRFAFEVDNEVPLSANFQIRGIPGVSRDFRFNLAPRFTYDENWFLKTDLKEYNPETGKVETTSKDGFTAIRQFTTSVNANTELYGTFNNRIGPFRAFRHILRPSATMTFRPDFSSESWGYYRSYVNAQGDSVRYPIAPGIYQGEQKTLTLGLGNVLQAKRATTDSLGARQSDISQLLTIDLGMSHNFALDSLNWSPLTMSARTRLLNKLDFNMNAQFSPYQVDSEGDLIDRGNPALFRLTNLGFTMRTSISGGRRGSPNPYLGGGEYYGETNDYTSPSELLAGSQNPFTGGVQNTPTGYADFSIPWSIAADLTYNVSKFGSTTSRRAIMNVGFDFNLTPKWKIHGRSGYDFIQTDFVTTNLSILRDFHDWEMGFNWVPFGQFASYQFDLRLKTGPLRDLLRLRMPQQDIPNRFGQLTN